MKNWINKHFWLIGMIISFLLIVISYASNLYRMYISKDIVELWEHLMPCLLQILWFWFFCKYVIKREKNEVLEKRKTTKYIKTKMVLMTFLIVVGSNNLVYILMYSEDWKYDITSFFMDLGILGMLIGICCFWCISNRIIVWCPVSLYCGIYAFCYGYYTGGWEIIILIGAQIIFAIIEYIITLLINLYRMKDIKKIKQIKQMNKDKITFVVSIFAVALIALLFFMIDLYYLENERYNVPFFILKTLIVLVMGFVIYNRYLQKRCKKEGCRIRDLNLTKKIQIIGFSLLMMSGSIRVLYRINVEYNVYEMFLALDVVFLVMVGIVLYMCIKRNIFLWYPASLFCVLYIIWVDYRIWEQWGEYAYKIAKQITVLVIVLEFSITLILNFTKWKREKLN